MDPLLSQFYKQYLQQVSNLTYPSSKLLKLPDIQEQLRRYFFDDTQNQFLPPPEFQRKVLKRLVSDILKEAKDENDEVSDGLMDRMGYLSSLPNPPEFESTQSPRILSYFLPDEPVLHTDVSTFDNTEPAQDSSVRRILIQETPQLLAAGSNVGLRTWEACLRLSYYLCTSPIRPCLKDANVIELGAGTGLLALICSLGLGANHVLATDGLMPVVDGIEKNIMLNRGEHDATVRMPVAKILDWTDLSELDNLLNIDNESVKFDYILGADITYHPELLDPLASLLAKLISRWSDAKILISATIRNEQTLNLWREACTNHNLVIRDVNEKEDHWSCPAYRLQTGLFHDQAFPVVIMDITKRAP